MTMDSNLRPVRAGAASSAITRREDVARLAGSVRIAHTLAERGARQALASAAQRALCADPRRAHRQSGAAAGQGRAEGDLSLGLAGGGRRQQCRPDVSRPEPLSRRARCPTWCAASTAPSSAPTRSSAWKGSGDTDFFAPIVADAEAGFGGPLNAFELMKAMIEAGAAGVHFEDQLASEKKCGHLGGKVLVPMQQFIRTLNAARLAADVEGVPTVLLARTDADSAQLLTSDVDPRDRKFLTGERTPEGFFRIKPGMRQGLCHRPRHRLRRICRPGVVGDVGAQPRRRAGASPKRSSIISRASCWPTTARPRSTGSKKLAAQGHRRVPAAASARWATSSSSSRSPASTSSITACSSWRAAIASAAWRLMPSCRRPSSPPRPTATPRSSHQREVGTGYFDAVAMALSGGKSSTTAMAGSTETAQFQNPLHPDEAVAAE